MVFLSEKHQEVYLNGGVVRRMRVAGAYAAVMLAMAAAPMAARAVESPPAVTPQGSATLVSESDAYVPGEPVRLGLRLNLAPGWHSYWSNPGDAGAPPTIDITGAKAGDIQYPVPTREVDGPFTSYVYTGSVLLPLAVTPPRAAKGPLTLQAHATWLACAKVCVPEEATLSVTLPPGPVTQGHVAPGKDAALFAAADAAMPRPSPFPLHQRADGTLRLVAPGLSPAGLYLFPDDAGAIDQGAPQPFTADAAGVSFHVRPAGKAGLPAPLSGVLTLTDPSGRVEALRVKADGDAAGVPAAAPGAAGHAQLGGPAPGAAGVGFGQALLLAFLGGLVLNLMPCVLPVLAMKAMAIARLSGAARGHVRRESLLYTAGVMVTFGAIGGVTLAAGALGAQAGWGVQFQSAAFSAAMGLLMLAIGLNFSGAFEFGAGVAGLGQGLAARGSFFTGMLAVLAATPCTAPFMASALAAAIVAPPAEGMAIFLALGAGLAVPYAALAAFPSAARLLPRPGVWMTRLRQALAIPMYGAALFLAYVVYHAAGVAGLAWAGCAAALLACALVLWGRAQRGAVSGGVALRAGLALGSAVLVGLLAARAPQAAPMALAAGAEHFSAARLAAARDAGRPVLVDMSASWCITCLVNERVALQADAVQAAFAQHHVRYLVGDWTRQDPEITAYLKVFGRNGVPLYVWYPPHGAPEVLPQILTPGLVLSRLAG